MNPLHIRVLASLQSGKPKTVKQISDYTGIPIIKIKNLIRDLRHRGTLVIALDRDHTHIFEVNTWKLSKCGDLLINEMKNQFGRPNRESETRQDLKAVLRELEETK